MSAYPQTTHNGFSPQVTGQTETPAPHYTQPSYQNQNPQNIQNTHNDSVISPAPTPHHQDSYHNEKGTASPQPVPIESQNGMPPPQPTFQQQGQNGYPQDHYQHDKAHQNAANIHAHSQQNGAQRNQYGNATPLASLQQAPAPVDCPICGVREMTRTEFTSGGTTQ